MSFEYVSRKTLFWLYDFPVELNKKFFVNVYKHLKQKGNECSITHTVRCYILQARKTLCSRNKSLYI